MRLRIKYVGDLVTVLGPGKGDWNEFTDFSAFLAAVNGAVTKELLYIHQVNRRVIFNLSITIKSRKE